VEVDVRHLLGAIRVPTLVVVRAAWRGREASRYVAEHIDGARYVELPGEDLFFFVGDTAPLLDAIEEFVTGRLSSASTRSASSPCGSAWICSSTRGCGWNHPAMGGLRQMDGPGVCSRVISAHITTADEHSSTRSEPAICAPERQCQIGRVSPTGYAPAIGDGSSCAVGGRTVGEFLIVGQGYRDGASSQGSSTSQRDT